MGRDGVGRCNARARSYHNFEFSFKLADWRPAWIRASRTASRPSIIVAPGIQALEEFFACGGHERGPFA
jgi:hypothetical protein